jgi:hypothetical protein
MNIVEVIERGIRGYTSNECRLESSATIAQLYKDMGTAQRNSVDCVMEELCGYSLRTVISEAIETSIDMDTKYLKRSQGYLIDLVNLKSEITCHGDDDEVSGEFLHLQKTIECFRERIKQLEHYLRVAEEKRKYLTD